MTLSETPRQQALREYAETKCAVCGQDKEHNRSFCKFCYYALPEKLQRGLSLTHTDAEFVDSYYAAKEWLIEEGLGV